MVARRECLPSGIREQLTHLMEQECLCLLQVANAVELTDPANTAQLLAQLQNAVSNLPFLTPATKT